MSAPFTTFVAVGENEEFVYVECKNKNKTTIVRNYHFIVTLKKELEKECKKKFEEFKRSKKTRENLNIIMIGMDSMSRLNFIRAMNKTYKYLKNTLNAYDMTGYTQVGHNTLPNLIPMLSGQYIDNGKTPKWTPEEYKLVWKNFSAAGYRTMFVEDCPSWSLFNYYGKSLYPKSHPSYFPRPLSYAMELDGKIWNTGHHCVLDTLETAKVLDYVNDFSKCFGDRKESKPYFSFSFNTRITHNYPELYASAIDNTYYKFLKDFSSSKRKDNTALFLFSDHGPRWGPIINTFQGHVEERMPMLYIVLPLWFRNEYPHIAKTLDLNTNRLTTHYDTHATIMDILYFDGEDKQASRNNKGISLFQEIPKGMLICWQN